MRKIFLSAGHSNRAGRDRGASGNGFIEGELTVELRNLIASELRRLGNVPIVDEDDSILSETIRFFQNKTTSNCIVIDLHWNASKPQATGTETLIPSQNTKFERDLAKAFSDVVAATLDIKLRGNHAGLSGVRTELESHHGRLGWMRLTGENILLEICFITNSSDMQKYQRNKRELAIGLAKVIFEFSRQGFETINSNTYVVQRGDTLWAISRRFNTELLLLKVLNPNINFNNLQVGQIIRVK